MDGSKSVVVGGSSGIGGAVVERQRSSGSDVLVWDVADGADVRCDIADPEQIDAAVQATIDQLGVPTSVTITAGVGHSGMLLDLPDSDWDRILGINAKGVWLVMRGLARPMIAAGGGSMVAISSVSAGLVDRSMGLYCASKATLDMVIKVAAAEWAPRYGSYGASPRGSPTHPCSAAPRAAGNGWAASLGAPLWAGSAS